MTETVTVSAMTTILAATSTITTLVGDVFDLMTGNALLTVFLAAGLLSVGIRIFKSVRSAAR